MVVPVEIFTGFSAGEPYVFNYTGLLPATNYTVRLAAGNTEGQGLYSDAISFVTASSVPGAPHAPQASNFTNTTAEFIWTARAPTART